MKNILFLLIVPLLFISCASSQKMLQKGRYDQAINKASGKLMKEPDNQKELRVLQEAWYQANRIDQEEINYLKQEGLEENWVAIYELYSRLNGRQDRIKRLPPGIRNQFDIQNYDEELIRSRKMAAGVSYERGMDFLRRGDRRSARKAYYEFEQARKIYSQYKDVDRKMEEARIAGMNHVLFTIENNANVVLPADFDAEIRKVALKELNTLWVNFDTWQDTTRYYDFYVMLNIKAIDISPEAVDRETYQELKEVQDGMKYVLDANGNVAKDSLGNDIKEPNIVTISARVTESIQRKQAIVAGSLDFIDLYEDQLVKSENISAEAVFVHRSAVVAGNTEALSEETARRIKQKPVPFPSDEHMLMDAAALLKGHAKAIIARNMELLEL